MPLESLRTELKQREIDIRLRARDGWTWGELVAAVLALELDIVPVRGG